MDTRSITVEAAKDIAFVKEKLQESMEDEATLTIRRWLYPDSKLIILKENSFTLQAFNILFS